MSKLDRGQSEETFDRLQQVLMSGRSEGVIFILSTQRQILRGALRYMVTGGFCTAPYDAVLDSRQREEQRSKRYLQPGDTVVHASTGMGKVPVTVVPER